MVDPGCLKALIAKPTEVQIEILEKVGINSQIGKDLLFRIKTVHPEAEIVKHFSS